MAQHSRRQSDKSSPARVVFLLEELNFGGTQRQTLELARRLDREKFHSDIWLLRSGIGLAPLAQNWQIPVVRLGRTANSHAPQPGQSLASAPPGRVDLFLLLTAIPNIWGRLLGKMAGLPCIIGNVRSKTANRQHERWLWPLAHHLICNNEHLQKLLVSKYQIPPAHLTMIPNGVDTDFFRPSSESWNPRGVPKYSASAVWFRTKIRKPSSRPSAWCSKTIPRQNFGWWEMGRGKAPWNSSCSRPLPAGRAFLLPGQVDIRPFLHQASIFALSSVTEALPNVVLEAMAAGLPVVATQVGGIPELVRPGQTGWLVPPKEPALLAEAMSNLLADADRRRAFGQAGRERVKADFSFNRMVSRYEALFDELLARQRSV